MDKTSDQLVQATLLAALVPLMKHPHLRRGSQCFGNETRHSGVEVLPETLFIERKAPQTLLSPVF